MKKRFSRNLMFLLSTTMFIMIFAGCPRDDDESSCTKNADCENGYECDLESGICVKKATGNNIINPNQEKNNNINTNMENTDVLCQDGIDNDEDNFIDCDDFDCSKGENVTVCGNSNDLEDTDALCQDGIDNDGNGFTDCDDYSCSRNENVTICGTGNPENTNELCKDGIDNDGDSFTDCSDKNCNENEDVTVCNTDDPENTDALCGDSIDNDGDGYTDCNDYDCTHNDEITVCNTGDPENTDALCGDSIDNDNDGFTDCDDYDCSRENNVTVCGETAGENTNELCNDEIDNDEDGFTDCVDRGCSENPNVTVCGEGEPENTSAKCKDGIDNDRDGATDCADDDCSGTDNIGECNTGNPENTDTLCADSIDNDGDGFTDCDDYDCENNDDVTVCETTTATEDTDALCNDGIDNDEDGYTDCNDYSCSRNEDVTICTTDDPEIEADPGEASLHILISEVCALPTDKEFVEIHNPTSDSIDLSNYYIANMNFSGGNDPSTARWYYEIVTGSLTVESNADFIVKFPEGASIEAGEYKVVSMTGSADFSENSDFEIPLANNNDSISDMSGSFDSNATGFLSNSGEEVTLFYWDGTSDLVQDIDYVVWGDKKEAHSKTGISIDGNDGNTDTTAYLNDTSIDSQQVLSEGSHAADKSWQRVWKSEGSEVKTSGNGIINHDETSENFSKTFSERFITPGTATE